MTMASRGSRSEFIKSTMAWRWSFLLLSSFMFGLVSPLDSFGSSDKPIPSLPDVHVYGTSKLDCEELALALLKCPTYDTYDDCVELALDFLKCPTSYDSDDCIWGWCPELQACIKPWSETCPIESDVEFSGGKTLSCSKGRCAAPQDNKCSWTDGSATFATYYWTDLNGHFTIPEGCAGIKCSGCYLSTKSSEKSKTRKRKKRRKEGCLRSPSSPSEYYCNAGSTGRDWCPELERCISPFSETCPIESDVEFSGGTTLSCSKGRCAAPQDNKCSWRGTSATFATYYWTDLNGHFTIPEGCAGIKCSRCHLSENDSSGPSKSFTTSEVPANQSSKSSAESTKNGTSGSSTKSSKSSRTKRRENRRRKKKGLFVRGESTRAKQGGNS